MFFLTYLRREMRRRMRQVIFIALGLAVGIGLVVTVSAASAGVRKSQSEVLSTLYGVGTDVTVTGAPPGPPKNGPPRKNSQTFQVGPGGAQVCSNGHCHSVAGQTIDHLGSIYAPVSSSIVARVAKLHGVKAAAGGLTLTDNTVAIPKGFGKPGSGLPQPASLSVQGVDIGRLSLGPLSAGAVTSGHTLRAGESDSDVAVVDAAYAKSHKLTVGSTVKIGKAKFTVVGIVSQPQGSNPPDVYIPLRRAQALATGSGGSLKNKVNTIYVTATSAAAIPSVRGEIRKLLPGDTVTTASSLASQVTGSLSSTAKLASDLGRWLSILVLIAAFAVASLLTMAAVARRVGEFGTLKALGWRSRRIIVQVIGESVVTGILGAAAGVGLGFAGAAIISAIAPKLTATIPAPGGGAFQAQTVGPGGVTHTNGPSAVHNLIVPMSASVTAGAIVLGVVLAILGGLLAGSFGSWRIAKLRPADALARVG
ncbi:MAG TPA: ABC transporter permease [Streptosporangiaceae bacterium]|nr:ABC transporter permease [Streptosporangiaceae bacterium]